MVNVARERIIKCVQYDYMNMQYELNMFTVCLIPTY